jgi:hypothetical protein
MRYAEQHPCHMPAKQDGNLCTWGSEVTFAVAQGATGGFDVIADPDQDQGKSLANFME